MSKTPLKPPRRPTWQKLRRRLRWPDDGKPLDAREIRVRDYLESRLDRYYRPAWRAFEDAAIAAHPAQFKKGDRVQLKKRQSDTPMGRRLAKRHGTVTSNRPMSIVDDRNGSFEVHHFPRIVWDGTKSAQHESEDRLRPAGAALPLVGVPRHIRRMKADCYPPIFVDPCVLRAMEFAEVLAATAWINDLAATAPKDESEDEEAA